MLVLSRKAGETLVIDGRIRVTIVSSQNGRVRIGIDAPRDVHVVREELEPLAEISLPLSIADRARSVSPSLVR